MREEEAIPAPIDYLKDPIPRSSGHTAAGSGRGIGAEKALLVLDSGSVERHVTARKTTLKDVADDRFDRDFWAGIPPEEKFVEAWNMTLEIWLLKGWDPGEPGLSRSVARIIRR